MEISFSKEGQDKGPLNEDAVSSINNEEEEQEGGKNAATSGVDIIPHGEVNGAIAPIRGALISLQGVPNNLTCVEQGTIHKRYVPSLIDCETLQMEGEDREDGQHQVNRSTHPYLFHEVDTQKRQTDLHNESREKAVHSYMQSTLDIDVSLHGGIPPGRPPDQELMRNVSQHAAPLMDPGGVGTLEGHSTSQRVLGRLKEEGEILPLSSLPTLTPHLALREDATGIEDDTIIVQGDYSLTVEAQKMFSFGEKYSTHGIGGWPLMHALAKLGKFLIGDNFSWKTNLQKLQPLLENEQL